MTARDDMQDCEYRNEFGRPGTLVNAAQGAAVHAVDDHSVNKPLPWIVLVGILAGLSLGISWWALDKAKDAHTQLLLLREDIREMTIDQARGK